MKRLAGLGRVARRKVGVLMSAQYDKEVRGG